MAPSCLASYALPFAGPALAFLYALSVLCFNAMWHECDWSAQNGPLLLRLAVLVGAVAYGVSLCETPTYDDPADPIYVVVVWVAFAAVSAILIVRTRRREVDGPQPSKLMDMTGRVVLVTGANAGIGRETSRQLVEAGATVILACRSESRAKEAMEDIEASFASRRGGDRPLKKERPPRERMIFLQLDLSSLSSVRKAVKTFDDMKLPLHVLILNAGVMMGTRQVTEDGFELTMAANHFGHFLLMNLLLPKLHESASEERGDARIVTLTSSTYTLACPGGIDLKDLNCDDRPYSLFGQYAQSKLANILIARELVRREMEGVDAASDSDNDEKKEDCQASGLVASHVVHPGLVRTDVVRNMPWYLKYPNIAFGFVLATLQKTPRSGAYTSVYCAASKELRMTESGSYYVNSSVQNLRDAALDKEVAFKLWELSAELVRLYN